jgi:hypothetical protein
MIQNLLHFKPCDEDSLSFREVQCEEHNEGDIKWIPFNDGMPGKI